MKRGTPELTKTKRLARRLKLPPYAVVGVLEYLWHWTARNARRGDIGRYDNIDIAEGIGWDGDAEVLVDALVAEGWVDASAEHRLVVHDWHDHADDATRKALEKAGETFVTGDPPRRSRAVRELVASDSRVEGEKTRLPEPSLARAKPEPLHERAALRTSFDAFWAAYPKRVAKPEAFKAWLKLKPDAALQQIIAIALARQRESEEWRREQGQFIPYPATYLRARRWEDEPTVAPLPLRSATRPLEDWTGRGADA